MVLAILDGRKTQTRRIVKPEPPESWMPEVGKYHPTVVDPRTGELSPGIETFGASDEDFCVKCKYGEPGDRLWVKETWLDLCNDPDLANIEYRADYDASTMPDWKWKSPLFMPKIYSRITLEITKVRVERLQDITEDDAKAEGAPFELGTLERLILGAKAKYRSGYVRLWESINGPGSWEANPWVWVIEFRTIKP